MQADSGEVYFEDRRVLGPHEKLMPGHKGVVYLSQHFELLNNYRVEELLNFENTLQNDEANNLYEVCRISHLIQRRTDQLSGGEKQRIALAKLLITSPKLLLLDEPFSNLDPIHTNILKAVINDIGERLQITCILVSHDALDTLSWADEILVMRGGRIVQKAVPEEIYKHPADEYTAALFGKYNLLNSSLVKDLPELQNIGAEGKNIFIRPENLKIVFDEGDGIKGEVVKTIFCGSYYEVEVLLAENTVTVRTDNNNFAHGDIVYIAFDPGNEWYI